MDLTVEENDFINDTESKTLWSEQRTPVFYGLQNVCI